jgi:glycosyltransferase involved in cell wall biosynthesis
MHRLALAGPSWPFRGGIARTTTALGEALHQRGVLATLETPRRQYPGLFYPGARDRDADACRRLAFATTKLGVLEPWTWPGLARRVREAGAEALVLPYWTWAWAPFWLWLLHGSSLPAVAIVHNPADHDASVLARLSARLVLGRCRGFLCHAHSVAAQVSASFPGRPVEVHPLPADVVERRVEREAARMALGVPAGHCAALCFGLIRPYKGVDVLLDAVGSLPPDLPLTLLLAGEPWGDLKEVLRRRLAVPDLAGRVIARLEWIGETDVATWLAAADVAVLPYRSATGSAVAAQALGAGLPIVGTSVGGLAEVIVDGVNGLLVAPGAPAALGAALCRILDGEERARLAEGAREAAGRWSWDGYAAALERLVATVLATGRS